jgi:methylated-DNA-protein-cysteine methyltransferase-like protein
MASPTLNSEFRLKVEQLMSQVPAGKVTTYGDLAALAGHPYAARIVGGMAHYGNQALPWHRLVNRFGGLAAGYPGGREVQQIHLEAEGHSCINFVLSGFEEIRWRPL